MAQFIKTWASAESGETHCWTGRAPRSAIEAWQRKCGNPALHVEVTGHRRGEVVTLETYYI
jgi:hypothetical protein